MDPKYIRKRSVVFPITPTIAFSPLPHRPYIVPLPSLLSSHPPRSFYACLANHPQNMTCRRTATIPTITLVCPLWISPLSLSFRIQFRKRNTSVPLVIVLSQPVVTLPAMPGCTLARKTTSVLFPGARPAAPGRTICSSSEYLATA